MPRRHVCTPVEQLQPFEWGHIVDLREAGWTYRQIAAHVGHSVSVVCCCFQQWSVEHSHTCRPGSGWPLSTDARQDWCIVQAAVAASTESRQEIRAHIAPAVPPRTIGNRLFAAGLRSCVPLARLPLTPWHCQAQLLWCHERVDWRVEWHSVVSSDESRFYLYASDGRTYVELRPGELHLPECIRPRHRSNLRLHHVGPSVTTCHIWCFCRVKQTVPAILHRLLTSCYWHFFYRKVMCFFSRTAHVHIRLL